MDFLKSLAIPQSTEQFQLLLFILNLSCIVLLPYMGFLLWTSFFSYLFNKRSQRLNNKTLYRFAKDLIDTGAFSKSGISFLAIIPALSLVFLYAQLLQQTTTIAVSVMGFGFLFLLAAGILLYSFKYTFRLGHILSDYEYLLKKEGIELEDVNVYATTNESAHIRTGRYGIFLLFIASILSVGANTMASNPATWSDMNTVFELFLSKDFLVRFLHFLAIGLGAAGIGVLYFIYYKKQLNNRDTEYSFQVKKIGIRLTVISLILQPILLILSLTFLPPLALSGFVYILSGIALLSFFITAHFLYAFKREGEGRYTTYALCTLIFAFAMIFTKDQTAIGTATKAHAQILAIAYDKDVEELKSNLGIAAKMMSGQEIFDAKCSACHTFDQKKVGPPYNETIPKYEGKKEALVTFILNPVKINPEYPNMPNQGLKTAEADSIASFLLSKMLYK